MAALHSAGYDRAAVVGHISEAEDTSAGSCSISIVLSDSDNHAEQAQ